jgi:hypothetical protein
MSTGINHQKRDHIVIRPVIIWRYADESVLEVMAVNSLSQDGSQS